MTELFDWCLFGIGGFIATLAAMGGATLWERLKPPPPTDYTLTLTDRDGIPVRQTKLTAQGVGRVINELDHAPNYYR